MTKPSAKNNRPARQSISVRPDYLLEQEYGDTGFVIGIDEAGRGPWSGPVTAAAFWINPLYLTSLPDKLNDSKKLSIKLRLEVEEGLCDEQFGHLWAICHCGVDDIDSLGILPATFKAMENAAYALRDKINSQHKTAKITALIDGNLTPPLSMDCYPIIKGDSKSLSIAAASIMAKQSRDRLMQKLAIDYPEYGWEHNAGYGTKMHQAALLVHGPTKHHRRSFAPIKKLL